MDVQQYKIRQWHILSVFRIDSVWGVASTLPIFFLPNNNILAIDSKRDKWKNWDESGGNGRMYIRGWFKPIFPLFPNWLLPKLKFQIPISRFWRPSHPRSHPAPTPPPPTPAPPYPIIISQVTPILFGLKTIRTAVSCEETRNEKLD